MEDSDALWSSGSSVWKAIKLAPYDPTPIQYYKVLASLSWDKMNHRLTRCDTTFTPCK